jgi:hypothetical protein
MKKKLWKELIICFPFISHRPHREQCLQQFFVAMGTCLPNCCLAMIGGCILQSSPINFCWPSPAQWFLVSSPMGRMIFYSLMSVGAFRPPLWRYIILKLGVCRQTHTLLWYDTVHIENDMSNNSPIVAYIRCCRNVFTELLPSNDREIHIQTDRQMGGIYEVFCWDGLRCHDIPSYIKVGSGIQKLMRGIHREQSGLTSLLLFLQILCFWTSIFCLYLKTLFCLFFKTQCFGDGILSPSSGKAYSVGPSC